MKLVLGVLDVRYRENAQTHWKNGSPMHRSLANTNKTTAEIARILEDRYAIMQTFFESRRELIEALIADAVRSELKNLLIGGVLLNEIPMQGVAEKLQHEFRNFIGAEEMTGAGIPTRSALEGRSVRFKSGRGPRRPSFVDSGLFESCMRVWFE